MEFYIKKDNKLHLMGSIYPIENIQEIVEKVIELENKINQIQTSLTQ